MPALVVGVAVIATRAGCRALVVGVAVIATRSGCQALVVGVAVIATGAGCQDVGCWLLVVGCWLLVVGVLPFLSILGVLLFRLLHPVRASVGGVGGCHHP